METDLNRVIYIIQELTNEYIQYFMCHILRSVLYIHIEDVVHKDLKSVNILINNFCDLVLGRVK